jgi:dephospho-CoA kinase
MHYAITGNIGSGKTTVCEQFERLGIPVYYADAAAKRLMAEDVSLKASLAVAFGPETYDAEGKLDRQWLAIKAFSDDAALARLNALVHPAVHADADRWRTEHKDVPYTLYEAAIVYETGSENRFDGVVVVTAPFHLRCTRVRARDQVTQAQFEVRTAKQWPDDRKEAAADYLINNDGYHLLLPQILLLHAMLIHQ